MKSTACDEHHEQASSISGPASHPSLNEELKNMASKIHLPPPGPTSPLDSALWWRAPCVFVCVRPVYCVVDAGCI